jgi:RNA polymerase sigma-70 factor, ECF subfamily
LTIFAATLNLQPFFRSITTNQSVQQPTTQTSPLDERILQLLANDATSEQGFRLLMQTYRERLYYQIRRMVANHADTDDILQNTFIKVYKGIGNFEGKSKLSTWLYRIAVNETITFCEARNRKATDTLETHSHQLASLTADTDLTTSDEITAKLDEAIASLPEKQRIVFNLRYFDEMPYEEMSNILDTSVGALKASFHHAVKKVERFFTDEV